MPPRNQEGDTIAKWKPVDAERSNKQCLSNLFLENNSIHPHVLANELKDKLKGMDREDPDFPLLDILVDILDMPDKIGEGAPFAPLLVLNDGTSTYSSPKPEDFSGEYIEVLVEARKRIVHPVAKARLAHLAWYNERRRKDEGVAAINAYVHILGCLDQGKLDSHDDKGIFSFAAKRILKHATAICRGLGYPSEEKEKLREVTRSIVQRSFDKGEAFALRLFSELALKANIMAPSEVADIMQCFLDSTSSEDIGNGEQRARFWLVLGRAYKSSKNKDAEDRAMLEAARSYVAQANMCRSRPHGAIGSAHWMELAIQRLHGLPNVDRYRNECRQMLLQDQSDMWEGIVPNRQVLEIGEETEHVRDMFREMSLSECLLNLTTFSAHPNPEGLLEKARSNSAENIVSSLFDASYADRNRRVVGRLPAPGPDTDQSTAEALEQFIAPAEAIRRGVDGAFIRVAKNVIFQEKNIPDGMILSLVQKSPNVDPYLARTVSAGFERWFSGDMVSALYILTPQLEGILRHLLKSHNHNVTTMNDSSLTQQDRTITSLYDSMRVEMDEILGRAVTEDIWRTFLSKSGSALRHGVAHALLSDKTPFECGAEYACWLIWSLVMLPAIAKWEDECEDSACSSTDLTDDC